MGWAHPDATRGAALKLRADGLSLTKIAERIGVPRATIHEWVRGDVASLLRTCRQCGREFEARAHPEEGNRQTCSDVCARYLKRQRYTEAQRRYRAKLASRA